MSHTFQQRLRGMRESLTLKCLPKLTSRGERLRTLTDENLQEIFSDADIEREWASIESELERACPIEDGTTGGVNPGDRRAVWYLMKGLGCESVLEIGTHVGASALHLAAALRSNARFRPWLRPRLVTVDIYDVNDEVFRNRYGLKASPREMMRAIGCADFVDFVTAKSVAYMSGCEDSFDFIFLDGNHYATTVYQELPRALELLNEEGAVLLHDYFPENRPLWANGKVVPGPYMATARLRREGLPIEIHPLGELPWPTKLGSRTTSLALVTHARSSA